jgi:hypothetical protein
MPKIIQNRSEFYGEEMLTRTNTFNMEAILKWRKFKETQKNIFHSTVGNILLYGDERLTNVLKKEN